MSLFKSVFLAGLVGFGTVGLANADPVTFATAAGEQTLKAVPDRVVALDVSAMDTLAALGVVPVGVVSPTYVSYLPEDVAGATPVGTFFEPDMERIAALGPDVIAVGARALAMADALGRIAPVADMSVGTDAYADGLARLRGYGQMLGLEDKAEALAQGLEEKAAALRARIEATGGSALILMTNGPKLSVFGAQSRFGWLHTELGFAPAVEGITENRHGEAVSFEYLAEANPDWLLVVDRAAAIAAATGDSGDGARATLDTPLLAQAEFSRKGQVIYLSPAELYIASGGATSLARTMDEISAALDAAATQ